MCMYVQEFELVIRFLETNVPYSYNVVVIVIISRQAI